MERNIPSLLLFHLIFFILLAPSCAVTSGLNVTKVVLVATQMTWLAAREHCRAQHSDLVTIRNAQDNNKLAMFGGWIGLSLSIDGQWRWSSRDDSVAFINWDSDEPDDGEWCTLKNSQSLKWQSDHCNSEHSSLCLDERMILVQEMKTWENAVQHCRELQVSGSSLLYEIASLPEVYSILLYGETKDLTTVTNEVWVGLRFLAGEWLWLNRARVTSSYLPRCPAQQQHCGALDLNSTQWKTINCSEKRNFLCSAKL